MKFLILFFLIFLSRSILSQDERFFKEAFKKQNRTLAKSKVGDHYYRVTSSLYEFDLDGDERNESFVLEKRDGEDWLNVHGKAPERNKIFGHKLQALGPQAHVYKISIRNISTHSKVFIIHYYEGFTKYLESRGTSRVYFLTIDNNDLASLAMFRGPIVWEEVKASKRQYHQRNYNVILHDFNNDGVKELAVRFNVLSTVFFYESGGKWTTF